MANILVELSKYFFVLCIGFFTLHGFVVFRYPDEEDRTGFYIMQNIFMLLIHCGGFFVLARVLDDRKQYFYLAISLVILLAAIALFRCIYPKSDRLILNNMCLLLSVSFIMLARLSSGKFLRQFSVVVLSIIIGLLIPQLMKFSKKIMLGYRFSAYIAGGAGIVMLLLVLLAGAVTNGSRLSFTIQGVTFQPSELVKIIFVFFIASAITLYEDKRILSGIFLTGLVYVAILALSKDLGSALIYFIVLIIMFYTGRNDIRYLLGGLLGLIAGSLAGYFLFSHVRTRVLAWLDPFSDIEGKGYQIAQSLFAIGTGGWFGLGLGQGSPGKIPVAASDFIFSAIAEEFGCLFAIFIILICLSNFLMFMNIALKCQDLFYRLCITGFAVIYGFQVFLTIGGVIKFIPLTGVTLPLVSYGGTSVLMTITLFSIIQGIEIIKNEK